MEKEAHSKGSTSIAVQQSSQQIVTLGENGKITVWDNLEDDEQLKTLVIGGKLHTFALKEDLLYTANEKGNALVSYSLEDGQCQGLVTRFTAPITDVASNKTHIAAGASDFLIRCINSEGDVSVLDSHAAPIISLSLAPSTGHLLSASGDGTVRLWTIKTKCCLQTYNILPKVNDASMSESACRMSWCSDSSQFAVPVGREIFIYSKDKEEPDFILKHDSIVRPVNACSYSGDDSLLASATTDGLVLVWRRSDNTLVYNQQIESKAKISSLCWFDRNILLYATDQGCFGSISVEVSGEKETKAGTSKPLTNQEIADMFDGSDDENFIDTEAAEDDYKDLIEEHEDEVKEKKKFNKSKVIEDDEDDVDLGSELSVSTSVTDKKTDQPAVRPDVTKPAETPVTSSLETDEQEPFQPGSTPTSHKHRYMVWNGVGMIRSFSSEGDNTIDVEFHDTSRHHTIHLNNTEDYSMADLSEECAVLATEDNGRGRSAVLCVNYGGGDDKQQWTATLDKHETIECVCVGGDFVAMATSSHMIRGFSTAGFQLAPFLIPGAPVAMAGYKNVLMVAYHTAPALNSYQHISVSILTMTGVREVLTHCSKLPLSGTSTLVWMGFTCEGTPLIYDSNGIMSMYRVQGHGLWSPVINTKAKDKHSNPFIVSVAEVPPQIRCVACKGSTYPSTSARPVLGILDYRIPLCGLDTDTGVQEETVWRSRLLREATDNWLCDKMANTSCYEKQEQTSLLKLFSSACREERLERAYQIAALMSEAYVKLAAQYANRTHEVELAQKLTHLAQEKALSDGEPPESVFGVVQPTHGFSGYDRTSSIVEEESDDLTKFTAARFSTAPNKELASSIITSCSQQSPVNVSVDEGGDNTVAESSSQPVRISFANILSQPNEDSQLSQDSQSSRSNPFKRKSTEAVKHTTISDLHKMLDEQEQRKVELKKAASLSLQPPKTKQSKLFAKPARTSESSKSSTPPVADENVEKPKRKVSAFDLYHKEKCAGKSRAEAMDTFKSLSKDVKKEYTKKADAINNPPEPEAVPTETDADESVEKKRKLEVPVEDEVSDKGASTRQTLVATENTKSKLAAFASN